MGNETQNQTNDTQANQTFTQADIDNLTAKHQEEMNALAGKLRAEFKEKEAKAKVEAEKIAKQSNMSELEKALSELEDFKAKYSEAEKTIAITRQKDETRKMMAEFGIDDGCLDFVFVPHDTEATTTKIKAFKEFVDGVKKNTFEQNLGTSQVKVTTSDTNARLQELRRVAGLK